MATLHEVHVLHAMYTPPSSMSAPTALPAMGGPHNNNSSLHGKPLPALPSPTLTNPDMVLPNDGNDVPAMPSPPRIAIPDGPPSPSYLREPVSAPNLREMRSDGSMSIATPKKEKRGLMSRKMMLLRSRTASNNAQIPRSAPEELESADEQESVYASSPTLMDVGNLLPEPVPQERRTSTGAGSFSDEDLSGMPQFLAKYDNRDVVASDDELDDSPAPQKYGYSVSVEGGLDEKRRKQEEDEQNSAILSKRAEAILANAKKRLNVSANFNAAG